MARAQTARGSAARWHYKVPALKSVVAGGGGERGVGGGGMIRACGVHVFLTACG